MRSSRRDTTINECQLDKLTFKQQSYESFCAQFNLIDADFFSRVNALDTFQFKEVVEDSSSDEQQREEESEEHITVEYSSDGDDSFSVRMIDMNQVPTTVCGGISSVFSDAATLNTTLQTDNFVEYDSEEEEDLPVAHEFQYVSQAEPFDQNSASKLS